jgi:outer membrane lipoprotein-sorting protein
MTLLRLALAPVFALLLAVPAFAGALSLDQISTYLNGLETAQADFLQVNADGSTAKGVLYIKRPGRARFEYATDKTLVMASGGQVAIFDPKSNQPAEQYPLARTPLNLILAPTVDLGRAKMVVGRESDATTTTIVAQDPDHPEYGAIRLVFTNAPVVLKQWIITDDSGAKTAVVLSGLKTGVDLGARLFSINAELDARKK